MWLGVWPVIYQLCVHKERLLTEYGSSIILTNHLKHLCTYKNIFRLFSSKRFPSNWATFVWARTLVTQSSRMCWKEAIAYTCYSWMRWRQSNIVLPRTIAINWFSCCIIVLVSWELSYHYLGDTIVQSLENLRYIYWIACYKFIECNRGFIVNCY